MCYNNASHANTCVLNLCHSSKITVSVFFFLTHIQIWWKFLIFVLFFYPSQILCCFHVANAAPANMTTAQCCCCCFLKLVWHQVCALTLNVSEIRHPSRWIKNMSTKVSLTLSLSLYYLGLPLYLSDWHSIFLSTEHVVFQTRVLCFVTLALTPTLTANTSRKSSPVVAADATGPEPIHKHSLHSPPPPPLILNRPSFHCW